MGEIGKWALKQSGTILVGIMVIVGGWIVTTGLLKYKELTSKQEVLELINARCYTIESRVATVETKSESNRNKIDVKFDQLNGVLTKMATDIAYIKGRTAGKELK